MNTTILIETKTNYGTDMLYIVSPEHIEAVYLLTGKKTINHTDIKALKLLGFTVQDAPAKPKEY